MSRKRRAEPRTSSSDDNSDDEPEERTRRRPPQPKRQRRSSAPTRRRVSRGIRQQQRRRIETTSTGRRRPRGQVIPRSPAPDEISSVSTEDSSRESVAIVSPGLGSNDAIILVTPSSTGVGGTGTQQIIVFDATNLGSASSSHPSGSVDVLWSAPLLDTNRQFAFQNQSVLQPPSTAAAGNPNSSKCTHLNLVEEFLQANNASTGQSPPVPGSTSDASGISQKATPSANGTTSSVSRNSDQLTEAEVKTLWHPPARDQNDNVSKEQRSDIAAVLLPDLPELPSSDPESRAALGVTEPVRFSATMSEIVEVAASSVTAAPVESKDGSPQQISVEGSALPEWYKRAVSGAPPQPEVVLRSRSSSDIETFPNRSEELRGMQNNDVLTAAFGSDDQAGKCDVAQHKAGSRSDSVNSEMEEFKACPVSNTTSEEAVSS